MIESDLALRGELTFAPHLAVVGRAGIGRYEWLDTEYDDPTYSQVFGRVGLRASLDHIYGGFELGVTSVKAHWDWVDQMPPHDGKRFYEPNAAVVVGWKLGPVDLGFDYTMPFRSVGFFIGGGYRRR